MPRSAPPRTRRALVAIGLALALAGPAGGEIYRWVDESGKVHFTQDLGKVPARHRRAAEAAAKAPVGRDIQIIERDRRPARPARRARTRTRTGAGRVHRIQVERMGVSMRALVRLNDRVTAPFILDTGASDVALPRWVADELGLDLDGPEVRTRRYSTANGVVEQKAVVLDSVQLGTARAENVHGAVSDTMEVGLLGLSFFNHFNYNIDPGRGLVTLVENDLEERGVIRGGRGPAEWRTEFRALRHRIEQARRQLDAVPFSRARRREAREEEVEALERQLEVLEGEADDAHVPFQWRE